MEAALIAAAMTITGWLVSHNLDLRRQRALHQLRSRIEFIEKQLEQLYGPLNILVLESERSFKELLRVLPRAGSVVFEDGKDLTPEEQETWRFWVEQDLLPRNERIKDLLMTKMHLVDGNSIPKSYLRFIDHHNAWAIHHRRWQKSGIVYEWRSPTSWPKDFGTDIQRTFERLKQGYAQAIDTIGGVSGRPN